MAAGNAVLANAERACLDYLIGSAARADLAPKVSGLEILMAALGKVLIPIVCAFGTDADLDQFREVGTRDLSRAREALAHAHLSPKPRLQLEMVREQAIVAAVEQGLSAERAGSFVEHAIAVVQYQLPARVGRD